MRFFKDLQDLIWSTYISTWGYGSYAFFLSACLWSTIAIRVWICEKHCMEKMESNDQLLSVAMIVIRETDSFTWSALCLAK